MSVLLQVSDPHFGTERTPVVEALVAIQEYQTARALDEVRRMAKTIHQPNFDFESACNLLALMTRLAARSIQLYEVDAAVDTMGLRFCTSKALTELLACAAAGRTEFANREEVEKLGDHFEERLEAAGFFFPETKAEGMRLNLRNMWARLNLTRAEVQTFHGMLRQIAYKLRQQGD